MKKAFTLVEQITILILLGVLAVICLSVARPSEIKKEALLKAGVSTFIQIDFATKNLLAKYTNNYHLTRMKDTTGEFTIEDADNLSRTVELFKKSLVGMRNSTLETSYSTATLTDGMSTLDGFSPSSYSGFKIKNGAYFGIKLYGSCTTSIDYLYDPSTPLTKTKNRVCATIFFDVNSEKDPNRLGVDQYIVALGKKGIK